MTPGTELRPPAFTVGSALRWLGHDCAGRQCWLPIGALSASLWFRLSGPDSFYAFPPKARVLVNLPTSVDDFLDEAINDVNWCTHRDEIEVSYRHYTQGRLTHLDKRGIPGMALPRTAAGTHDE